MLNQITRRGLLKGSAAATVALSLPTVTRNVLGANEKLNVAGIGCGGKGSSDIGHCAAENIVGLADVDWERAAGTFKKFPDAKKFKDFREMLDKMDKQIDAVTVSTPDHMHAQAGLRAMKMGKHLYCQKPLTHTVEEARMMRQTAREQKVATQMGNQGTALDSLRTGVEIIQSGGIGEVTEVHVWSNRPVWPQGRRAITELERLAGKPAPDTLDWDLWLGGAKWREYNPAYLPFKWRGFWDFGTGALGDMACHTMNLPFWALSLEYPTAIQAEVPEIYEITPPEWSVIGFEFPKRTVVKTGKELGPVALTWYDGTRTGLPNEKRQYNDILSKWNINRPAASGSLMIGTKGAMYAPGDYGQKIVLLPDEKFKDYTPPKPWIARRPGQGGNDYQQHIEWLEACKGGPAAMSNFEYAAYFTEIILLGNLAMRVPGVKVQWDGPNMKSPNSAEANKYVSAHYREGWELNDYRVS